MHLDSFSGAAADLPKGRRTAMNVLGALTKHPRVSVWDMDQGWLRGCLNQLKTDGLIEDDGKEPYPWIRFNVTPAGAAAMAPAKESEHG